MCEVKDGGRHGWEMGGGAVRSVDGCADGCLVDLVDWLGGWIDGTLAPFSHFDTPFFSQSFWVLSTWVTGWSLWTDGFSMSGGWKSMDGPAPMGALHAVAS